MKTALHVLAMVAVLAVVGCHDSFPPTDPKHTNDTATPALIATRWCLESISSPDSNSIPSVDPALGIYVEFAATGELTAFGGCNMFNGRYQTATGGVIHISDLVGTKIHCQESASIEALYATSLLGALTFRIDGAHLSMICSGGRDNAPQRVLRFVACRPDNPPPPPPDGTKLAGRRWCLQQIQNMSLGPTSVNQWVGMYVEFDALGKVRGYTDSCRFSGGYSLNGAGLTTYSVTGEPITPNAAAVNDWQSLSEWRIGARFLAGLRGAVKYQIDEPTQMLRIFAIIDSNAASSIPDTLIFTDCTPATVDTVYLERPFQAKAGRLQEVAGEPFSFRIAGGPIEDSRCPSGTQCVQAGQATVPLLLMMGVIPNQLRLYTTGEAQTRDALLYPNMNGTPNYLVQLLSVYPYPQQGVTVQQSDYVVNMNVQRKP
ncbi:MAG TPA: META domain-containing protein [Candidatus Kapabacteria bacterium]|nr:META domain-containing protein [Candidatus Kapabacteria bacterium]